MKHIRRRRHLRPRPSRAQVRQQIDRVCSTLRLFQLEWVMESQKANPSLPRLRFVHDMIVAMRDEVAALRQVA